MTKPEIHTFDCEPLSVIDGDTLILIIDVPQPAPVAMNLQCRAHLRLAGLNCPELASAAGPAARLFTVEWLTKHPAPYSLTTRGEGHDKYGRWLGTLRASDGACLNDDLLSSGNAVRM